MTVKIYCDICGDLIPEEAEGEGWDTGNLHFGWGIWGEKSREVIFDFDAICKPCTDELKNALDFCIDKLLPKEEGGR